MAYQINLTGQEIDERLQNVGTPADNPDANGTLFARLNKNVDDVDALNDSVAHIQDAQTATDKVVAQHTADINTLQTAVGNNKTEQDAIAQKVEKNATAIGNADDPNDAKGSLYARVKKANASTDVNRLAITTLSSANKKNQTDITDIGSRQTNIEKVVSGAQEDAYFSLLWLNFVFNNSCFDGNIGNVEVRLYRWSGKRYAQFEMFTKNNTGVSQKRIRYEIILKQEQKDGANVRTPYIHYNDDGTEEELWLAVKNAFGGRISYNRYKKRRWRIQAFLNGKPITAPFDFRVSIDTSNNVSLTKEGMMRSVPATRQVKYDGYYDVDKWINCKVGEELDLSYRFFNEPLDVISRKFPNPGDVMLRNASSHSVPRGVIISVFQDTPGSYCILWSDGMSIYEIGIDLDSKESGGYNCTSPAKKLCDNIYDYASKMNSGTLRDLYIQAGAKYNEATGYYELNGLTDITEEEMRKIYLLYITNSPKAEHIVSWLSYPNDFRTNIAPRVYYVSNIQNSIGGNDVLEVLVLSVSALYIQNLVATAHGSFPKLRRVIGYWVYANNNPSKYDFSYGQPFSNCPLLEEIRMKSINKSHTFAVSPNLSKESVLYMITNANPPSGAAAGSIAITLHPTAYARLKDDADIVAALEAKNGVITLVSA